jgi:hypothetical protein
MAAGQSGNVQKVILPDKPLKKGGTPKKLLALQARP